MKMAMRVWMVFVLLAFIATSASGEIRGGTISVSPFVGGYTFEGNENLQTKALIGTRLGYNLTDKWGLEGVLTYMKTDNYSILTPADLNVWGYRLDALYHLCGKGRFACSLAAGLGIRSTDYKDNSLERRHVLADYGLVLQYFLTDNLAARGDIRHMVLFNDNLNNVEYTLGLTYYFGGYKTGRLPAVAAASAAVAIKDSDNDGVPDKDDDCPGTPRGVKVDSKGCPVDSDKDGVPDYLDKCPGTPSGAKVDNDGCPGDSDKDGVYDDFDKCPGTPLGAQVDSDGCVVDSDKDGVPDSLDKCPDTLLGIKVDNDGCPADYDKDGVPDYLDKCPDTPLGVQVDGSGCAVLAPVPVPAPVDSDKDGVIDSLDKCPDTPLGVKVDKNGCPPDSDKDGVPDYLDKCPGTKLGATVDSDGCRMEELKREAAAAVVAKEMFEKGRATIKIEFDFDKADIKPQYHQEINKFADVMQKYPEIKVVIEGNTDSTGKEAHNQKLSEKRAESVKKYLVKKFGVEESRLTTKGFGESRPIASNKTKDGRQKNRRVEAVLDYVNKK